MPDTPEEIQRIRDHHHRLAEVVTELQVKVAELGDPGEDISSLRAEMRSITASINSNTTAILQRMTTVEAKQEAADELSAERWRNFDKTMGEVKGLLESVPMKLGEDMKTHDDRIKKLEEAYQRLRGGVLLGGALLGVAEAAHAFLGGK